VSNGVGITPVFTMLKAALQADPLRPTWFIHGCRNSDYLAFAQELDEIKSRFPNLNLHLVFSKPKASDQGRYQHEGYVDGDLVQSLTPTDSEYYLCGSNVLMAALLASFEQAGIPESRLHYELFVHSNGETREKRPSDLKNATVRFKPSDITANWSSESQDDSILSLAESVGLKLKFGCRSGVCGSCTSMITQGSVSYNSEPSATLLPGSALICIARPASEMLEVRQ
jgi:NAD(P)H-flavin reductase